MRMSAGFKYLAIYNHVFMHCSVDRVLLRFIKRRTSLSPTLSRIPKNVIVVVRSAALVALHAVSLSDGDSAFNKWLNSTNLARQICFKRSHNTSYTLEITSNVEYLKVTERVNLESPSMFNSAEAISFGQAKRNL